MPSDEYEKMDRSGLLARIAELENRARELERTQAALRTSEERFRCFAHATFEGILIHENGIVLEANERFASMLGYNVEEVIGSNSLDMVAPESLDLVREKMMQDADEPYLAWGVRKDGTRIPLEIHGRSMDYQGRRVRVAAVRDLTDWRRAQEELARHRDRLNEIVQERLAALEAEQEERARHERLAALGQFTEIVAHELRHPLTIIRGSLFLVNQRLAAERDGLGELMERIDRSIERCDRIVEDLLEFAHMSPLRRERTDVAAWVARALDEYAADEEFEVERRLASDAIADIDRTLFRKAVRHVWDNARQAIAEKRRDAADQSRERVRVAVERAGDRINVCIEDTGAGMSEHTLARACEPFFSTKAFGVGLGMSIVKQAMELHHGGVEIESEEGRGTKVTMWLPAAASG